MTAVLLMQIATGFWAFKTLAAAHELDQFVHPHRGDLVRECNRAVRGKNNAATLLHELHGAG